VPPDVPPGTSPDARRGSLIWVGICPVMTDSPASSTPYALVVDDDGLIRMDAMDILEDAGFRTFEASDGDTAIALLAENHALIVLLFTDVQMPGSRNGFAVARETARQWPHIAIVVASGQVHPGPDDMPDGARFIGKPFTADMVHDHLKEILPDGQKPEPLRD
jgi:CheY-like chemotaxis protein